MGWNDFESILKTLLDNSPGTEASTEFQSPLLYYETQESIDFYIPTTKGTFKSKLTIRDFGENMRFESVESMKLEILKYYNAKQLITQPLTTQINITQS